MSNEQEYIGVCVECHSDQPASYMERSIWERPPCKYCGGVVHIIPYRDAQSRERYLKQQDRERGLT